MFKGILQEAQGNSYSHTYLKTPEKPPVGPGKQEHLAFPVGEVHLSQLIEEDQDRENNDYH